LVGEQLCAQVVHGLLQLGRRARLAVEPARAIRPHSAMPADMAAVGTTALGDWRRFVRHRMRHKTAWIAGTTAGTTPGSPCWTWAGGDHVPGTHTVLLRVDSARAVGRRARCRFSPASRR